MFAKDALSDNAFLGGKVRILQPKTGYRAGVDPVFLAAAVAAKSGQSVLELGCGGGVASLCLAARVADLELVGVELQASYADLARQNAARNGITFDVQCADLTALGADLRQRQFHHVIANPPYYHGHARTEAADTGREIGLAGATPLAKWVSVATKRLRPKGEAVFIQRADRLADLLGAMAMHLGSLEILPLAPRIGRAAALVLVRGRKGGRADLRLHAPLVLHEGARHDRDGEDYTPPVRAILREGAAMAWGDAAGDTSAR